MNIKKFLALFICMLLIFGATACKSDSSDDFSSAVKSSNESADEANNNANKGAKNKKSDKKSKKKSSNGEENTDENSSKNKKSAEKTASKSKSASSSKKSVSKNTSSKKVSSEEEIVLTEKEKILFGLDEKMYPACLNNEGNSQRIANLMKKAQKGGHYVIAVLGGSISQGAGASIQENSYGYKVKSWWEDNFPNAKFDFVNAGLGSTNPEMACYRIETDLLSYKPDFVVLDFAVNTYADSRLDLTYQTLIYRILSCSKDTALMAIQFTNADKKSLTSNKVQKGGTFPCSQIFEAVEKYSIPSVSFHNYIWPLLNANKIRWQEIYSDYIHPNDDGHFMAAAMVNNHLKYVKNNLAKYNGKVPDVPSLPSDDYVKVNYITNSSSGVSAKDVQVLSNNSTSSRGWKLNGKSGEIKVKLPDCKSAKLFVNMENCQGGLQITNGKTSQTINPSQATTPMLVELQSGFKNSEIKITPDLEAGTCTIFGIAIDKK